MMLLKNALKNLKKGLPIHIVTAVQLAVVLVIGAILSSSVLLRYKYYKPFKDILNSKGLYVHMRGQAVLYEYGAEDNGLCREKTLKEMFPEIKDVISCCTVGQFMEPEVHHADGTVTPGEYSNYLFYDDELIKRCPPEISEGRWLSTSDSADCIEVVVSSDEKHYQIGDTIVFKNLFAGEEFLGEIMKDTIEAKVVGRLAEGQKIVGNSDDKNTKNLGLFHFWGDIRTENDPLPPMIMSADYCENNDTQVYVYTQNPLFIEFYEDTSDERVDEIRKTLMNLPGLTIWEAATLEELNERSLSYVFEYLRSMLPIIIILLIMVAINSVSSSAITVRRDLKTYATFYITGLRWKHCAFISAIQAVIVSVISMGLMCVALPLVLDSDMGFRLYNSWESFVCIPAIIAFYIAASFIMPFAMLSGTTPKEILSR